ncbi:hypothetical protein D6D22_09534 [Aureobasidium pullulans]|uniref:Uncharacterized protein n=1 Tax=Aureobasidium pullulans TaxID=5580 RepID=A0A4S8X549_AURPU|nr:hypothetical protein D6D22_09534 [Aureobasidium pullulans]
MNVSGPYRGVCSQSGLTLILPYANGRWCIECIKARFTLAIKDKLCGRLPVAVTLLSFVRGPLTPAGCAIVLQRAYHWGPLTTPPIYCAKPSCSKHLIPPIDQTASRTNNIITCPNCQT